MEKENPGFYSITPSQVRYDNDLDFGARLLYGEISALTRKEGYCWANNKYFSELYKVHITTIQRWLKQLNDKKYIKTEVYISEGTRKIWLLPIALILYPIAPTVYPPTVDSIPPHTVDAIHNNTSSNNLNYNTIAPNNKKILFCAESNKLTGYDQYVPKWKETYPALDIKYQISKMETWLMEHPKNRKSNYLRFIGNWLRKAQDSALPIKKKECFPL